MRLHALIAALTAPALLTACDLIDLPLEEGTYELVLEGFEDEGCGFTEDDVGVGAVEEFDLWWDERWIVLENQDGYGYYDWDGEIFTTTATEYLPVDDACEIVSASYWEGEPASDTRFFLTKTMDMDVQGDCSAWNVSAFPCGVKLGWEGNRIAD